MRYAWHLKTHPHIQEFYKVLATNKGGMEEIGGGDGGSR
jgi:hypothetical protein